MGSRIGEGSSIRVFALIVFSSSSSSSSSSGGEIVYVQREGVNATRVFFSFFLVKQGSLDLHGRPAGCVCVCVIFFFNLFWILRFRFLGIIGGYGVVTVKGVSGVSERREGGRKIR